MANFLTWENFQFPSWKNPLINPNFRNPKSEICVWCGNFIGLKSLFLIEKERAEIFWPAFWQVLLRTVIFRWYVKYINKNISRSLIPSFVASIKLWSTRISFQYMYIFFGQYRRSFVFILVFCGMHFGEFVEIEKER